MSTFIGLKIDKKDSEQLRWRENAPTCLRRKTKIENIKRTKTTEEEKTFLTIGEKDPLSPPKNKQPIAWN